MCKFDDTRWDLGGCWSVTTRGSSMVSISPALEARAAMILGPTPSRVMSPSQLLKPFFLFFTKSLSSSFVAIGDRSRTRRHTILVLWCQHWLDVFRQTKLFKHHTRKGTFLLRMRIVIALKGCLCRSTTTAVISLLPVEKHVNLFC